MGQWGGWSRLCSAPHFARLEMVVGWWWQWSFHVRSLQVSSTCCFHVSTNCSCAFRNDRLPARDPGVFSPTVPYLFRRP